MSLLNYTSPFLTATPQPPLTTHFYQPHQFPPPPPLQQQQQQQLPFRQQHHQQQQQVAYTYPVPQKPFLAEERFGGVAGGGLPPHPGQLPPPTRYDSNNQNQPTTPLERQPPYTRVHDDDGTKTKVHAVIDYDDYDEDGEGTGDPLPPVTPIQGPIYLKNGSVPVVPLYSHPVLNNGSFVQIPILWTALSVALGLELRGEYIRGVPCIKRHQQLFCPTAGNSYPLDRIELFIDENKALMKRMYGEFDMGPPSDQPQPGGPNRKRKRSTKPGVPDLHFDPGPEPNGGSGGGGRTTESFFSKVRSSRQNFRQNNQSSESGRVDACESKVEIVTPYWASNSAGKIRAIVNTQHFEQAIHQEVCAKVRTNRCSGDCGCEQKYKWHRLLAYDPDNDCKGIFMDWFLFPSCCVCRCNPT